MSKTMRDGTEKVMLDDIEVASNTPEGRERMKRWGVISALPSEFLVVYRRGKLRGSVGGQGGRCFKWPGDTVAIVPTTLKEVLFKANQITVDNVDVQLRGMVLYRICDPLRIYRLINFTHRQQAEAKLGRIIADTCRSHAKWLVANMTVEQCMRRRKEEIAAALKTEVAHVVGAGDPAGWGVEIVTVDIQDIYVQDDDLFASLQAKFKADREGEAELARIRVREDIKRKEISAERELETERQRLTLEKARLAAEVELAALDHLRHQEEEKFTLDRFRVEQNGEIVLDRVRRTNENERVAAEGRRERVLIESEAKRIACEQETTALRERLAAENSAGSASLERLFISDVLPKVSEAVAASAANMRFSVYQTTSEQAPGATPFGFLLAQLLEILDERLSQRVRKEG